MIDIIDPHERQGTLRLKLFGYFGKHLETHHCPTCQCIERAVWLPLQKRWQCLVCATHFDGPPPK
jgi:hypothetical protein